jgi:hypothetical protein
MPRTIVAFLLATVALCLGIASRPIVAQQPVGATDLSFWRLEGRPDSATVIRTLGLPDSIIAGDDPSQADPSLPTLCYGDLRVVVVGGLVLGQWVVGRSLATSRGIRVGDAMERVLARYGKPARAWDGAAGLVFTDPSPNADDRLLYAEVAHGRIRRLYIGYLID